ncbi:DUF11 domain-containing protein [Fibrella sp. HMF5335]|uniref:DUF11 domain-containing protein n=1 Tax=Fibrella rubiginis TaxID=2817060 RepID=A0A939GHF0_9BACT|nr:SdrD B-like domain-containing protein [Fibrella rubiginis]MBO0937244.1 DUF11 domain-containing protein [Fibrella rubiginis]
MTTGRLWSYVVYILLAFKLTISHAQTPTPVVGIPCYVNGPSAGSPLDAFVGVYYNSEQGANSLSTGASAISHLATFGQIGSTWGAAYDSRINSFYAAASLKRHSGYGPSGSGAIYKISANSAATSVGLLINLNGATGTLPGGGAVTINTGGATDHGNLGTNSTDPGTDNPAFSLAGKSSLGDIDISPTKNTLWVVNIAGRQLVEVNISNPSSAVVGKVYPITTASTGVTPADGQLRPWGLEVAADGSVYLGAVASAEDVTPAAPTIAGPIDLNSTSSRESIANRAKLIGYIFRLNKLTGNFTQVAAVNLNYLRGTPGVGSNNTAEWVPWYDSYSNGFPNTGDGYFQLYPQPLIADIEIVDDGSMLISVMDRFGLQTGSEGNSKPGATVTFDERGRASGDVLRVLPSGSGWSSTISQTYGDVMSVPEDEAALGGIAYKSGTNEFLSVTVDAINASSNGLSVIGLDPPSLIDNQDLVSYSGAPGVGTNPLLGSKGLALGDVEIGTVGAVAVCTIPSAISVVVSNPTCAGLLPVNDGSITLTSVANADRFAVSGGSSYTGTTTYASASAIIGVPTTLISGIPNAGGTYTIRFFNGADDCKTDYTVTVAAASCIPSTIDLSVTKIRSSAQQSTVGGAVTFKVVVKNNGTTPATNIVVNDLLALADFSGVSGVGSQGGYTAGTGDWAVGTLSAGASATLTVTATVIREGISYNTASLLSVTEGDINPNNNIDRACVTVPVALTGTQTYTATVPAQYSAVEWFKDGASVATGNSLVINTSGVYTFTAPNGGCAAGTCCPLIVQACSLSATAAVNGLPTNTQCANLPATLTAQASPAGSYTYAWAAPAGVTLTGANTATATTGTLAPGVYSFTVTVSSNPNCLATAVTTLTVTAPPSLVVSNTTICAGQSVNWCFDLVNTGPSGSNTQLFGSLADAKAFTNVLPLPCTLSPTTTVTYVVGRQDANGCVATQLLSITVNAIPDAGPDQVLICEAGMAPTSATLAATAMAGGAWSQSGTNPAMVTFTNPTSESSAVTGLTAPGTYTLVWLANGCSGQVFITVPVCQSITPLLSSIGDKTFVDVNSNGIQDVGDLPLAGVLVTLMQNGTVVATTTTASSGTGVGCYSFTGLTPGIPYSVSFTAPPGFAATTFPTGISAPVTLSAGENNTTVDAGFTPLTGSLGDFVWKDLNNNGLQDVNELGVANVTVQLFTVVGGVMSSTPVATTVTSASGLYAFTGLPQGDYQLKFSLPASETTGCAISGKPNAGNDARDSDIDPLTGLSPVVSLNPSGTGLAANNTTIDMGVQRKAYDPTGYIYCYATNTILTGGTISITGPGSVSITLNGSTGVYQFLTDGTPGSYTLAYTHPNGYSVATVQRPVAGAALDPSGLDGSAMDKDGVVNGWVSLGSQPNSTTTALVDGSATANPYYLVFNVTGGDPYIAENNLPIDCSEPLGSIGHLVWKEVVQDGKYDTATEQGVANVTVKLLEVTSPVGSSVVSTSVVSATVTDGAGKYLFSNLAAGRYVVEFVKTSLPSTCVISPDFQAAGVPDALNSDANPLTGQSPIITLLPTDPTKRDILTVDAALVVPSCKAVCIPIMVTKRR